MGTVIRGEFNPPDGILIGRPDNGDAGIVQGLEVRAMGNPESGLAPPKWDDEQGIEQEECELFHTKGASTICKDCRLHVKTNLSFFSTRYVSASTILCRYRLLKCDRELPSPHK